MRNTSVEAACTPSDSPSRDGQELTNSLERIIALWQEQPLSELRELLQAHEVSDPKMVASLAIADQERRWRQGNGIAAEEYLRQFPLLGADIESAGDLIYSEYLLREERGERPTPNEFVQRFPEFQEMLEGQIAFHHALDEREPPPDSSRRLPRLAVDYEILKQIGHGGMGIVYQARQVSLNRLVALKVLRAGQWCDDEQLTRFRAEAETVARLHHPNIVQIYDYGEQDGLPYLALEYVEGGTLADQLSGEPWAPKRSAELVRTLACAVNFAHERGVIHRDLKPANVLMDSKLQNPCSTSRSTLNRVDSEISHDEPKIADFGLAKTFYDSDQPHTQSGTLLGTPSYMAPEQARGRANEIGPATDTYALGALLYHLLAGRPPFQAASAVETLNQVLTQDPVSIDRLQPKLPSDLATICGKCLHKEPHLRYSTAAELAEDLHRFLADRPIHARRATLWEQSWRWRRRNPVLAALGSAIVLLLLGIALGSTAFSLQLSNLLYKKTQAEAAERSARQEAQERLWDAYLTEIKARQHSGQVGQRFGALETLDKANELLDQLGRTPARVLQLRNAAIASLVLPDLRLRGEITGILPEQHVVVSSAADRYLVREPDGYFSLHALSTGARLLHFSQQGKDAIPILSPDGRYAAGITAEGAIIWRLDGKEAVVVLKRTPMEQLSFASSGNLAAFSDAKGEMQLLELKTGKGQRLGRGSAGSTFSFHLPTRRVAVCGPNSLQIISCDTGNILSELPKPTSIVSSVAWHPSGKYLAAGCYGDQIALWDVDKKTRALSFTHASSAMQIFFTANGETLATVSPWDGQERLWDTASGHLLLDLPTFVAQEHAHWSSGNLLLLRRQGSRLELWEFEQAQECRALATGLFPSSGVMVNVVNAALSPDGRILAVGREASLELWDTTTGKRVGHLPSGRHSVGFDAQGDLITACNAGVFRWPRSCSQATSSDPATIHFGPPERWHDSIQPSSLAVGRFGRIIAGESVTNGWQLVQRGSDPKVASLGAFGDARHASISHDERLLAVAGWDQPVTKVFHASGELAADLPTGVCGSVLFSPDNRWLATTPNGVQLWRTSDWRLAHELKAWGSTPGGLGLAFSPDSRVMAIGQPDGITRLIEPESGAELARLQHPDQDSGSMMAFRFDQTQLVTLGRRRTDRILVWDLAAIKNQLAIRGLGWPEHVLRVGEATGARLAAAPSVQVILDDAQLFNREQAWQLAIEVGESQTPEAVALLERAVSLDPNSAYIHNQLAWLLATGPEGLRRPESAVQHARRATEIETAKSSYYNTLGVALYRAEQFADSITALECSQKLDPPPSSDIYDYLFLGLAETKRGDRAKAQEWLTLSVRTFEDQKSVLTPNERAELLRFFNESRTLKLPSVSDDQ